jgi:hypothetical protein
MASAIGDGFVNNGPGLVLGTRIYIPNANTNAVGCYDYAAQAECTNFPKVVANLHLLYTVNADPQRPDCIWVNSDSGTEQIQNFDAYTGGPCVQGQIRVFASDIVAPSSSCTPSSYTSLTVTDPPRSTYSTGSVEFENGNAAPLPGIPDEQLNSAGSVDLSSLALTTQDPLPQFVITLNGETSFPPQVGITLSWTGTYAPECTSGGQTVTSGGGGSGPGGGTGGQGSGGQAAGNGYWLVASDGGIFSFGADTFHGSTGNISLNKPIVGMAAKSNGAGYWLVASDGGVFTFGNADFHGSAGNITLNRPIVGMATPTDGKGYWLVASDGGIVSYGDASFYGSTGNITLNKPIVGMASTPDGKGYWLVASDGGIFSYGDASFYGSTGNITLNKPIVGMAG